MNPTINSLTESDLSTLDASFIDPDTAAAMRLSRVDRHEGGRLMGRHDGGDYAGIVLPNVLPGEDTAREYRLRLDNELKLWDADGKKQRPAKYLSPIGDRGRLYFPPGIEPQWLVDTTTPILIVEGEKKAAACQRAANMAGGKQRLLVIGITGVDSWKGTIQKATSANGQEKITGPLPDLDRMSWEGRIVFILFDADLSTNKHVLYARRRLKKELVGRGSDVVCVDMPEVAGCKGIDDLLGHIARESGVQPAAKRLMNLLDKAYGNHLESSEVSPLPEILLPVPKLDAMLIPESLRPWLTDIAERMQCPLEFPVIAALTAIGVLVGKEVCVKPKERDGWLECPNLWGAIVGDPGGLKSPAVSEAMQYLREIEKREDDRFRDENPVRAFDLVSREAEKKAIKQQLEDYYRPKKTKPAADEAVVDKAINLEELESRFKEIEAFQEPTPKRLTTSDATIEKLGELLNENPRGLLNFRDELAGFFANLDKQGREGERAFFLEGWKGLGEFRFDRITRGSIHVENMTLSLFGTIQPTIIEPYLASAGSRKNDDGLIPRFQLLVYPDMPMAYEYIDRIPVGGDHVREIFNALFLMKAEDVGAKRLVEEADGHAYLSFDRDAQMFFKDWLTELEHQLRDPEFVDRALKSHLAKYRGLMPSLALIFHLIKWASGAVVTDGISLQDAKLAAAWCSFLRKHAERLYSMGNHTGIRAAHEILAHIEAGDLGDEFSLRYLYRKKWKNLSDPAIVKSGLEVLSAHGHIEEVQVPTEGRQKIVYVVNERLK